MSSSDDSKLGPLFSQPLESINGLTVADLNRYLSAIRKLDDLPTGVELVEGVYLGDGLGGLTLLPDATVDLIIADPPQSPWEGTDLKGSKMTLSEYYEWNQNWLKQSQRVLKETGAIYLFTHWRYSGMYQALLSEVFNVQTRISWRFLNGGADQTTRGWRNALGDIWFASKTGKFYFHDRQVETEDFRDKIPGSNFWGDIVDFQRETPAQLKGEKPASVLKRVIQAGTAKLNWIVDPFMRSGTSGVVSKKMGRRFIGFEVNRDQLLLAMKRIDQG